MTHKTKGIVLRTVKYGETSLVATVLTELFGVQTYMVTGLLKKLLQRQTFFSPAPYWIWWCITMSKKICSV